LLRQRPRRLLLVTTGNITNDALIALFDKHLVAIVAALGEARLVELGSDRLVVHDAQ
jgi:predicted nuclease of predicted toxin-antitoxin system